MDSNRYGYLYFYLFKELSLDSLQLAQENINKNDCSSKIQLVKSPSQTSFFEPVFELNEDIKLVTFTMCNPPFYSSDFERVERISSKNHTIGISVPQRGSDSESFTSGGEYEFVTNMFNDSRNYSSRILYYFKY